MADTLADQLLEAIQPHWVEGAEMLRNAWRQTELDGNDQVLLGWLAGQIETLFVVPFLAQADLNISVTETYQGGGHALNPGFTSFALELEDGTLVPLTYELDTHWQWRERVGPMKALAEKLRVLRESVAPAFTPPDRGPRRRRP